MGLDLRPFGMNGTSPIFVLAKVFHSLIPCETFVVEVPLSIEFLLSAVTHRGP